MKSEFLASFAESVQVFSVRSSELRSDSSHALTCCVPGLLTQAAPRSGTRERSGVRGESETRQEGPQGARNKPEGRFSCSVPVSLNTEPLNTEHIALHHVTDLRIDSLSHLLEHFESKELIAPPEHSSPVFGLGYSGFLASLGIWVLRH